TLNERKVWRTDVCPQSVSEGIRLFQPDQLTGMKGLGSIVRVDRFGCDDLDWGSDTFGRHGSSAQQTTTTYWTEDEVEIGNTLEQLQHGCPLSGHALFILEGMNHRGPGLLDYGSASEFPRCLCRVTKNDLTAVFSDGVYFHLR